VSNRVLLIPDFIYANREVLQTFMDDHGWECTVGSVFSMEQRAVVFCVHFVDEHDALLCSLKYSPGDLQGALTVMHPEYP